MIFFRLNLSKRIDFLKQNISLRFKSSVIRISEKQTSTKILKSWRLYYGNYLKHFAKVLSHHKWSVSVKVVVSSSVKTVVCGLPHKMLKNLRLLESPRHFHRWATLSSRTRKKKTVRAVTKYTQKEISKFSASVQFCLISLPCWKYFAQVWRWRLKNPDWNESYFFVNLYHMLLLNYMLCILLHQLY